MLDLCVMLPPLGSSGSPSTTPTCLTWAAAHGRSYWAGPGVCRSSGICLHPSKTILPVNRPNWAPNGSLSKHVYQQTHSHAHITTLFPSLHSTVLNTRRVLSQVLLSSAERHHLNWKENWLRKGGGRVLNLLWSNANITFVLLSRWLLLPSLELYIGDHDHMTAIFNLLQTELYYFLLSLNLAKRK